jgi:rubredoxin
MSSQNSEPLVNTEGMICPRCEVRQNLLAFTRLKQYEKYESQTAPLYKCKLCKLVFAPLPEKLGII